MVPAGGAQEDARALRSICLALPETSERLSHGAPTFFVREKRGVPHGPDRPPRRRAVRDLVRGRRRRAGHARQADPEKFFVPPYVGHRGWLGVRLDVRLDWNELAGIAEDAYAEVAPAKLVEAARSVEA